MLVTFYAEWLLQQCLWLFRIIFRVQESTHRGTGGILLWKSDSSCSGAPEEMGLHPFSSTHSSKFIYRSAQYVGVKITYWLRSALNVRYGTSYLPCFFRPPRTVYRVVFEAEANGEVRQVVSPTLPFPLSLPSPFHSPYVLDKPVGGKVRSSEGGSSTASPAHKYHPEGIFSPVSFSQSVYLFVCMFDC